MARPVSRSITFSNRFGWLPVLPVRPSHNPIMLFYMALGPGLSQKLKKRYEATFTVDLEVNAADWTTRRPITRPTTPHERSANAKLAAQTTTFRALRNVSLCPWKIGVIVAAALVILHIEHDRTT
jgi:hypothetical protein